MNTEKSALPGPDSNRRILSVFKTFTIPVQDLSLTVSVAPAFHLLFFFSFPSFFLSPSTYVQRTVACIPTTVQRFSRIVTVTNLSANISSNQFPLMLRMKFFFLTHIRKILYHFVQLSDRLLKPSVIEKKMFIAPLSTC